MIRSALIFLAVSVLASPFAMAAEQPIPAQYRPYVALLQAQKQLHDAQYQSAAHRLRTLESLLAEGHASWLEIRRQRLTATNFLAKTNSYNEYVEHALSVLAESDGDMYQDPAWRDGQLLFTDMHIRTENDFQLEANQTVDLIQQLNKDLAKQHEQVAKLSASSAGSRHQAIQHRLNIANCELAVTQARVGWLQELDSASQENASHPVSLPDSRGAGNKELTSAAIAQCTAHTAIIEHLSVMEQKRLGKVRELQAMAMASQRDVDLLQNKISQLKSMKEGQRAISQFLENNDTQFVSKQASSSTVAKLRGRFQKCEAKFQLQSSTSEHQYLREVLNRLELAAQQVASNASLTSTTGLGRTLRIGQQNEIKSYRDQIRLAELKSKLAECRLEVIQVQEEQGFTAELVVSPAIPANDLTMALSSLSLTHFLTVPSSLELPEAPKLVLESIVDRKPIGSLPTLFHDFNINYRPIQLTNSVRSFSSSYRPSRSRSGASSLRLGKRSHVWTYEHGSGIRSRNKVSSFSLYGSSLYSGSRYGGSRFGRASTRAYPFGALDSRLRRFQPAGYPPWLLPGSPTNFRW